MVFNLFDLKKTRKHQGNMITIHIKTLQTYEIEVLCYYLQFFVN